MKKIKLTQGQFTLVDDALYEELKQYKWCANKLSDSRWYAWRVENKLSILMHRQVLGLEYGDGKIIDHINRDSLDNRKENLRVVSNTENSRNHKNFSTNTSGYNGVDWMEKIKRWRARITVNYKEVYLGVYPEIKGAIKARKQGDIKYWGEARS